MRRSSMAIVIDDSGWRWRPAKTTGFLPSRPLIAQKAQCIFADLRCNQLRRGCGEWEAKWPKPWFISPSGAKSAIARFRNRPLSVRLCLRRTHSRAFVGATGLQLTDKEMAVVLSLAAPIEAQRRAEFLLEVEAELAAQTGAIGEGLVHRLARTIQRRFFALPQNREGETARRG